MSEDIEVGITHYLGMGIVLILLEPEILFHLRLQFEIRSLNHMPVTGKNN